MILAPAESVMPWDLFIYKATFSKILASVDIYDEIKNSYCSWANYISAFHCKVMLFSIQIVSRVGLGYK